MRKKQVPFSVIIPTIQNVDEIQGLLYPHYFSESVFKTLEYDAAATRAVILNWLETSRCFLIKSKGKPVGFCAVNFTRTFYKQIEADVEMFFVMPEYRGTGISRALSQLATDSAKELGADVMYSSCLSGIDDKNNSQYTNLWKKLGFEVLGTVMIRSNVNG